MNKAYLILESGLQFEGISLGVKGIACGEIVFNTSMFGYQEVLTDPSYAGQIISFTYPHIGNVGVNEEDHESDRVWAAGLIIKNNTLIHSNWRSHSSLEDFLHNQNIVGIKNIDTRHLTHIIREIGCQRACIISDLTKIEQAHLILKEYTKTYKKENLISRVTTPKKYQWIGERKYPKVSATSSSGSSYPYHIIVYDFGVKYSILKILKGLGCNVTVVPAATSFEEVMNFAPNGIIFSNGPGDPTQYTETAKIIRKYIDHSKIPLFGICLGHQLIALASGANIVAMKYGHHGINHPIQDLKTKKIFITTQNHNYTVDTINFPDILLITHVSLFDQTIQGIKHREKPIWGLQGHPEASPGAEDIIDIFEKFLQTVKQYHSNTYHNKKSARTIYA